MPDFFDSLPDSGQGWVELCCELEIIEPGDSDVIGDSQTSAEKGLVGAACAVVVATKQRIERSAFF